MNALAFSGTNILLSTFTDHDEKERRRHVLAVEKLQRARNEWNKDRIKPFDFINKRLQENNDGRACSNYVDEAMLKYYQVFAKRIKPLPPVPKLSKFLQSIRRTKK